jgi:ABC transport system ATP-binding/permease protein
VRGPGSGVRDPGSGVRDPGSGSRDAGSATTPVGSGTVPPRLRKKLTFKEAGELKSLPPRIEALEEEQARLQAEAASPEFYKESGEHIRAVLARVEAIGPELEAALARWMELDERG